MSSARSSRMLRTALTSLALAACSMAVPALPLCQGNCSIGNDVLVGSNGAGNGSLSITGGDVVTAGGAGFLGAVGVGTGTALISGAGSRLSIGGVTNSQFFIGHDLGTGVLTVQNGGQVTVDARNAGTAFGDARLNIGRGGNGTVNLLSGGSVIVRDLGPWGADEHIFVGASIGTRAGSGTLSLSGGSTLEMRSTYSVLDVGVAQTAFTGSARAGGLLEVLGGSVLTIEGTTNGGWLTIGRGGNTDGRVLVSGAGSLIDVKGSYGTIAVANPYSATNDLSDGKALLQVGNGAVVRTSNTGSAVNTAMFVGFGLGTGTVHVEQGGLVDLAGDIRISERAGTALNTQSGFMFIAAGGTVSASRTYVGDGQRAATNGTLAGSGVLNGGVTVRTGGLLSPGASPGRLTINGDLALDGTGTLRIEIAGLAEGQFDQLVVSGPALWNGGVIEFVFIDGFLPQQGDSVNFIAASSFSGLASAALSYSGAAPGFSFELAPDAGGLRFVALNTALPVPEPGTVAMWAAGLSGLVAVVRRRRQVLTAAEQ